MKAVKKFLYMVTAVATIFATGCTEQIEPAPLPNVEGQQVYFDVNQTTAFKADETGSIEIPIYRVVADEAFTVAWRFSADNGIEEPAAPSFAAGETEAKIVINYDIDSFELGQTKTFGVLLTNNTSPYGDGATEMTFTITRPEPWNDLGEGLYVDDFLAPFIGFDPGYMAVVSFQQHAEDENRIRVVNPFGPETFWQLLGGTPGYIIYDDEDDYLEFDITDPDNVLLATNPHPAGFQINFSDVGALDAILYVFTNEDGSYVAPITYKDGVIRLPAGGAMVLGYIVNGELGGYYANESGKMAFALPGVTLADMSIDAEFVGTYIDNASGAAYASVNFTLGADVARYRFAVVEGDVTSDYSATVTGIVEEELEGVYSMTADETEVSLELATGIYTIVAVPYNANGEADASSAIAYRFYFPGAGSGDVPDVEIRVAVDAISAIFGNEEYEQAYPSSSCLGVYIEGDATQIEALYSFVGTGVPSEDEITNEEVLSQAGEDLSEDFLSEMAEYGYTVVVYKNLDPETTYDVIIGVRTIYGELKTFRTTHTTAAAATTAAAPLALPAMTSYAATHFVR